MPQATERNTGNSRDFWSKSDSQRFGTPLISSTCRSNSLGRLTERIRNQKEITVNQKPRNSQSWNGGGHQHAAGTRTGFLPEIIQTPFRAREALLLARFLVPQSHFIPPQTASSCQIKPSVVCRSAIQTP